MFFIEENIFFLTVDGMRWFLVVVFFRNNLPRFGEQPSQGPEDVGDHKDQLVWVGVHIIFIPVLKWILGS